MLRIVIRGFNEAIRILKNDLHVAPLPPEILLPQRHQIDSVELDRTGIRFQEPQDGASRRCFSAAGFADESEGFTAIDIKTDIVDRFYVGRDF